MNHTGHKLLKDRKTRYCPFLDNPFKDCYCEKFTGMDVENMLLYCAGDFKKCRIYSENIKQPVRGRKKPGILI